MKSAVKKFWLATLISLASGAVLFAQSDRKISAVESQYLISAKAGGINFVSGNVTIAAGNARKVSAQKGNAVQIGERISTGFDGKAEILLNPGSFVRLGENSQFEFADTALDDLKVRLTAGSAIFEVIASSDFKVAVATPKASFLLVKSGIYRIDAMPDGAGRIQVWKGRAQLEISAATTVKAGTTALVVGGQAIVEKFDRDDKTELEAWSKQRAKELAKINAKLQSRAMSNALVSSYSQRGWSIYDSFGLWVRDPFTLSYCFLPFGYGWSSPYGFWFQRDIWSYRLPQEVFYNPRLQNDPGARMSRRTVNPPFQTVQPNPNQTSPSQPSPSQSNPGMAMPQTPRDARPTPDADAPSPRRGRGSKTAVPTVD